VPLPGQGQAGRGIDLNARSPAVALGVAVMAEALQVRLIIDGAALADRQLRRSDARDQMAPAVLLAGLPGSTVVLAPDHALDTALRLTSAVMKIRGQAT
jgi:hypothetical protein